MNEIEMNLPLLAGKTDVPWWQFACTRLLLLSSHQIGGAAQ